jgi:LysM repeat protein
MAKKRWIALPVLLAILILLAACNRSAQPSNPDAETGGDLPFPTSEFPQMDILQTAAVATQTAQAGAGGGVTTPPPAQSTPGVPEATSPPAEPTAAPAEPTAVPPPTATPEPIDCENPYTVQQGEWVYSIARKCGVDPNAIIQLNGLVYPYTIFPGDQLTLP